MPWIETIPYDQSSAKLRQLYDRVKGPGDNVDNIMMMHSLRPHTMEAHMAVYKHTLHHSANTVPKWFLETLGVWVSLLNRCSYCVDHHFAGLQRLMNDPAKAEALRAAMAAGDLAACPLTPREIQAMRYARTLTRSPWDLTESDATALRMAGWNDGEILEINQVCAYFAYANRTVLGLGCSTDGDILGLSPNNSDNPDDWGHR
jgi:uncharacterized peroxidase-related enzyme